MRLLTILLILFVATAEIDMCVPSFPQIQNEFQISPFKTEAILGANLVFHCIAALFAGSLGDRYGKKRIIHVGFLIFIVGSVLSYFAISYYALLFGRILQGIGIAGALVLAPIMIIDLYQDKTKQQKMLAMLNGFVNLAICLAPAIGSYTTLWMGWRSNFLLLALLGVVAAGMFWLFIPNDTQTNPHASLSIRGFTVIFKSRTTSKYILCLSFLIASYYLFAGMSSLIYVDSLKVSFEDFSIYQGILTLAYGLVSIFSGTIIQKMGKKLSFMGSIALVAVFLLSCIVIIAFNIKTPVYIAMATLVLIIGMVIPCNMAYVLALDSMPQASGKISSAITNGKWIITIIGVQTASFFYTYDFRSTGLLMLIMLVISFAVMFNLLKNEKQFQKQVYDHSPSETQPETILA